MLLLCRTAGFNGRNQTNNGTHWWNLFELQVMTCNNQTIKQTIFYQSSYKLIKTCINANNLFRFFRIHRRGKILRHWSLDIIEPPPPKHKNGCFNKNTGQKQQKHPYVVHHSASVSIMNVKATWTETKGKNNVPLHVGNLIANSVSATSMWFRTFWSLFPSSH